MAVIFMTGYKLNTKETMIVPIFRLKKDDETDTKNSLYVDLIGKMCPTGPRVFAFFIGYFLCTSCLINTL